MGGIAVVVLGLAVHTLREVSEPATKPAPSNLVPGPQGHPVLQGLLGQQDHPPPPPPSTPFLAQSQGPDPAPR